MEELQFKSREDLLKEQDAFVRVVNPPRHGKFLLQRRIFHGRSDKGSLKCSNNSNVTSEERVSPRQALYYFWLSLRGFVRFFFIYSGVDEEYMLEKCNLKNPFDASSKKQLPLVIAVDEYSKLTDELIE